MVVIIVQHFLCRYGEGLYHLTCKHKIRRLNFGSSYPGGGSSEDHEKRECEMTMYLIKHHIFPMLVVTKI